MGLAHWRSLVTLCLSFFLSLSYSLFQADPLEHRGSLRSLICLGFQDMNGKALCIFTPSGKASVASVNRASPLSQGFISFLCKQRNISFYSFLSHSFISFIHSPISSILRVSLDSAEAGPRHLVNIIMSKYFKVHTGACQLKLCWELQHLLKK